MKKVQMNNEKKVKDSTQYLIGCLIISIGFIICGFHIFLIGPNRLCDCSYSQGVLKDKNSYYKTLSLKNADKPQNFDIICADYNKYLYFRNFDDKLFEKMNSVLSSDSTEHYIQIWYQSFGSTGVRTHGMSYDYYQIIIDGQIIKAFNKWDNKKVAIGAMIIGVILLFFCIKAFVTERKKINQKFSEHNRQNDSKPNI